MKKVLLMVGLFLAAPVFAVDGVIEISSTCALNSGCFSGDTAGYPVTITAPGSYRLTTNLLQTSSGTTMIQISGPNVSLDLNGFSIKGNVTCSGLPVTSCTGTGSGDGISIIGAMNTRIFNGTISNIGDDGIVADGNSENPWLDSLTISENGNDGIQWDNLYSGQISNSTIFRNRNNGISLGVGLMHAIHVLSRGNGNWGQFGGYCSHSLYNANNQTPQSNCVAIGVSRCGSSSC